MTVKQPPLQAARVVENWEQAQQTLSAARQELRRAIQITVALYAVGVLLVQPLSFLQPWLPSIQLAALMLIFGGSTLWFVRLHARALAAPGAALSVRPGYVLRGLLPMIGLVLALTAWSTLTMPLNLRPEVMQGLPSLPPVFAILIPAATAAFFAVKVRPQSIAARLLGLDGMLSLREILIGATAGACLGVHFWIISNAWHPARPILPVSLSDLVWLLSFTLGLVALAEETFFRGLLYRLYEVPGEPIGVNFAPILLLNAFVYLLPGLATVLSGMWPWRLVYGLGFAALAIWLRNRERSLAAPIAANVVFTLLFTLRGAL